MRQSKYILVLDTNIIVSALLSANSKPYLILQSVLSGENVIVYSKKGKVAYIATWNSKHIFSMKRYNDVFLLLNSLEDKLETPLDFNVSVDFMTMESIMEFLKYNTANNPNAK